MGETMMLIAVSAIIIMMIVLIIAIFLLKHLFYESKAKNCTVSVEGTLVRLSIKTSTSDGITTSIYDPIFKYVYEGKEYQSKAIHDFSNIGRQWTYTKPGEKFMIYINPQNPMECIAPIPQIDKELYKNPEKSYELEWGRYGFWKDWTEEEKKQNKKKISETNKKWIIAMVIFFIILILICIADCLSKYGELTLLYFKQ